MVHDETFSGIQTFVIAQERTTTWKAQLDTCLIMAGSSDHSKDTNSCFKASCSDLPITQTRAFVAHSPPAAPAAAAVSQLLILCIVLPLYK